MKGFKGNPVQKCVMWCLFLFCLCCYYEIYWLSYLVVVLIYGCKIIVREVHFEQANCKMQTWYLKCIVTFNCHSCIGNV